MRTGRQVPDIRRLSRSGPRFAEIWEAMVFRSFRLPRASQLVLFAPAVALAATAMLVLWNRVCEPVVFAAESPGSELRAVIRLRYPHLHPLSGELEAMIEIFRMPGHDPVYGRSLGRFPSKSAVVKAFRTVEWPDDGKIRLRSEDGEVSRTIPFEEKPDIFDP